MVVEKVKVEDAFGDDGEEDDDGVSDGDGGESEGEERYW